MTDLELTKWLHDRRFRDCRWFGHLDRCDHRIFYVDWHAIASELAVDLNGIRAIFETIKMDPCTGTGGPRNDRWACFEERGANGWCSACRAKAALSTIELLQ